MGEGERTVGEREGRRQRRREGKRQTRKEGRAKSS